MSASLPPPDAELAAAPAKVASRRALEAVLLYGFAVFAALLAMLAGAAAQISAIEMQMVGIALATTLLALVPAAINRSRPPAQRHLLLAIFSLSFVCFYVFSLLTQYFLADPLREGHLRLTNIDPSDILMAQAISLLGLACLYLGYLYPIGRVLGDILPRPTKEWSHSTALAVAVVMTFLGWVVFLGNRIGLIPSSFGSGALGAVATWMYFGIGLLAIIHIRYRSQPALLLMWTIIPPTVVIAFLTASKRFALSPLIAIVLAYIVVERRIRFVWVMLGALALIALYPIAQFWRDVSWGGTVSFIEWVLSPGQVLSTLSSFLAASDIAEYFRSGLLATGTRLDVLGITSVIIRDTPSRVPFQGGWSIGYIPLSFIPRILWPGKPLFMTGQWVTDNYGGGPHIISSTGSGWIGELYFNFGTVGVILGMAFIGAVFRILHETLFRADATIPALLAGVIVLWTTCPTLEANLLSPFSGSVFFLAPVLLTHLAVRVSVGTTTPVVHQARTPPPRAA